MIRNMIALAMIAVMFQSGCKRASLPVVTTNSPTSVTMTTATCGGNVISDGGDAVSAKGVCWDTAAAPTTAKIVSVDGVGTGSFTSYLTKLHSGTKYHVRAYAKNSAGTAYGDEVTFETY